MRPICHPEYQPRPWSAERRQAAKDRSRKARPPLRDVDDWWLRQEVERRGWILVTHEMIDRMIDPANA